MPQKALITGVTGQDGSLLSRLLLKHDVQVHGIVRRHSSISTDRIDDLMESSLYNDKFFTYYGDLTDSSCLTSLISKVKPNYVFNLGAQSHVKVSFETPEYTADVDAVGVLRLINAVKEHAPDAKFYQAGTSEMFGGLEEEMPVTGYTEKSQFHPRSPYGAAKLYGHWITKNYREAYNLFASNGILFNHESPYRGRTFVTRKITTWCATRFNNSDAFPSLKLGNIYAKRDWGHAQDFVEAMWKIVNHDKPDDFVIATGETYTVKHFISECFKYFNWPLEWQGEGINEKGISDGKVVIEIDPKYFRPSEVDILLGDATKARAILNWTPKYNLVSLVKDMLDSDLTGPSY